MPPSPAPTRDAFGYWMSIPTRWSDNDMFGHVNNVVYFRFFEAVIVNFLIEEAKLDWTREPCLPYAAEVIGRFRRPLSFPQTVDAGLTVTKIGRTSVVYWLGLFTPEQGEAAAEGSFVHVFVDRATETPVDIPARIRAVYARYRSARAPDEG
jgi:acyl-CoA thioester hydrolase